MNILVIDVGTSGMRGVLVSQDGTGLYEKQVFYHVTYMENSWVEQKPADWENAMYDILRDIAKQAKDRQIAIDAISLTAQRSSVLPVDESIRPIGSAIMWQDKRTVDICRRLEPENGRIFAKSGARVSTVFSGCKMTWLRENCPELYRNTYKFLVIPDYLLYLLTGKLFTSTTYGSRSNLMNLRTGQWDEELLSLFQVRKEKLPELTATGCIHGYVCHEAAVITGCPEGIPVISAGGDQQCAAIGQGVVREGILSVTAGTGGFLNLACSRVPDKLHDDVICNCAAIAGQYVLETNVLTCCSALDWFRREFYQGEDDFAHINEELLCSPVGAGGCYCLPYFQGRNTPDFNAAAQGHFLNVTLNTRRCDLLRSLLEGICCEIANGIDSMSEYMTVKDIYINGGLTNSDAFNDMQAGVYGRKVIRRGKADATVHGALAVAGASLRIYPSVEEAWKHISRNDAVRIYPPAKAAVERYATVRKQINESYRRLYAETL